jgi:dihydrofolate reductase/GNAT superfamily N-acetyltransferase
MVGLIVARSKNNVIGKNGQIPWRIKGEQKQFKELTTGNIVVMGRKSYEEIGRPLPNRLNIIVSRTKKFEGENLITVSSVREAIGIAKDEKLLGQYEVLKGGDRNLYIAGGYGLYKEAIAFVEKMYITEVNIVIDDGDTFFPEFDANAFDLEIGETGGKEIKFTRTVYTRHARTNEGTKSITYRKLTEADLNTFIGMRIAQLTEEYTAEGKNPPEGVDLETALKEFYHRHMADGTFVSWLALDGEKIIGTSGMSFVEKPPYFSCPTGRLGLLSSMFTNPNYRRMGIAKKLLDKVVNEARQYGCGSVWITASNMGVKLYTAYGFEHNGNFMQYKL